MTHIVPPHHTLVEQIVKFLSCRFRHTSDQFEFIDIYFMVCHVASFGKRTEILLYILGLCHVYVIVSVVSSEHYPVAPSSAFRSLVIGGKAVYKHLCLFRVVGWYSADCDIYGR